MMRCLAIVLALGLVPIVPLNAQTDLDAFMRDVLARRDDNWKKLQQYVLDEREVIELRDPSHAPLWGERRDYTWYIRDGFFVRSPVRVNGAAVPEADRVRYEREFLERAKFRDSRPSRGGAAPASGSSAAAPPSPAPPPSADDVSGIITQTRQPQFISSAYFLRFKFEEGQYALVGREQIDGREVLRIEYYPAKLFTGTDRRRRAETTDRDRAYDAEFRRLMNKVSLVTLWVEPSSHQIVRYTFDNVSFDFLPAQWLVHVDEAKATMTMGQPFPGVWLPSGIEASVALTLAVGRYDLHYGLEYHDYKRADVATKVEVK